MSEKRDETCVDKDKDQSVLPCAEEQSQQQEQNRRELIQRFSKYALASAPLLLFTSTAAGKCCRSKPP
jgi:hypothetical protein